MIIFLLVFIIYLINYSFLQVSLPFGEDRWGLGACAATINEHWFPAIRYNLRYASVSTTIGATLSSEALLSFYYAID
jgi:hypothetical protein